MRITILLSVGSLLGIIGLSSGQSADGSRCQGVSCSPPQPGASCQPKYGRDDGCCPEWQCTINGYTSTIYGRMSSQGNSYSSGSSYSYSSSTGGGGSSGNGFQIQLPNLFGNLFAGLG